MGTPSVSGNNDGTASSAKFNQPYGIAMDLLGWIYVADGNNNVIRSISPLGMFLLLNTFAKC